MDLDEIKQILDMMRQHDLAEFELERDNIKIRLRKNSVGGWNGAVPQMAPVPYVMRVRSLSFFSWLCASASDEPTRSGIRP